MTKCILSNRDWDLISSDLLVCPVSEQSDWGPSFLKIKSILPSQLKKRAQDSGFEGKPGQNFLMPLFGPKNVKNILLLGIGTRKDFDLEKARRAGAQAVKHALHMRAASVLILPLLNKYPEVEIKGLVQGAHLGSYRFAQFKQNKKKSKLKVVFCGYKGKPVQQSFKQGEELAAGVMVARDLVNAPPNELSPVKMAREATRIAKDCGLKIKVLNEKQILSQGMNLLSAVGQGGTQPPRFIHMTYQPRGKSSGVICLIGKGVTFDSGGLSLKPANAMMTMKMDMAGGAAVIGAMQAIARLKPKVTVHGIVPATENMPDGNAYRPGDVIVSGGKSVEVLNTDAEGRLALADAITYANKLKPDFMIDLATLTGSCIVALGHYTAAVIGNTGKLTKDVLSAADACGENMWELPRIEKLRDSLKSDIADLKNIGGSGGGTITAAMFLEEFVSKKIPWAHIDIAGPAWSDGGWDHITKGGTGFAVLTLAELVQRFSEQAS